MSARIIIACVLIFGLLTAASQAQFTREGGTSAVAGTLQKPLDTSDTYVISSRGNQILFVDLDADVYINSEAGGEHETGSVAGAAMGGEEGGAEGEDCGGSGNGRFMLEVLDLSGNQICMATRPTKPGWDTDPRMACLLADSGSYLLKVGFASVTEHGGGMMSGTPQVHPYLLNVSLRQVATEGMELPLEKAIKGSVNLLPVKD